MLVDSDGENLFGMPLEMLGVTKTTCGSCQSTATEKWPHLREYDNDRNLTTGYCWSF